jgi:Na+-transporting NADH:ubiquinone oxidoreductase subunit NqrF
MTHLEESALSWSGETGFIIKERLVQYLEDLAAPIYYAAGPPALVAAMREMLSKAGADEDDIRSEDFAGY